MSRLAPERRLEPVPAGPGKAKPSPPLHFPGWGAMLAASDLTPTEKAGYGITIRWYLSFCRRGRVAVDHDSAREFIRRAEQEKRPAEGRLERWREALRWFFRTGWAVARQAGGGATEVVVGGPQSTAGRSAAGVVPPDQGWAGWLESMRKLLRVRHLSYRTEQSYLGWARRFVAVSGRGSGFGRAAS